MKAKRIIIAGGREFSTDAHYDYLIESMNKLQSEGLIPTNEHITIVSGHARGADKLGERLATNHDIPLVLFPAQWQRVDGTTDRAAGYKRNALMAVDGDILVAFWDGVSKGTKNMIDVAKRYGLEVHVFYY